MINKTIKFYDNNADELFHTYNNADMSNIYSIIEKYLKPNCKVLDIGFGSGRDIQYFQNKNYNIYGIDASKEFIKIFKKKYPKYKNNVGFSILPKINIPNNLISNNFDLIFSMATWMHLQKKDYFETIKSIKNHLKKNGIFILGYSNNKRVEKERHFEVMCQQ